MEHIDVQGKGNKVAATQGTITAQNPTNQSNRARLFDAFYLDKAEEMLSKYDYGIVSPKFVVNSLQMSERIINSARMPEDKKGTLRCAFALLLAAVEASEHPTFTCSITGEKRIGYGNNAYPFEGRCSDEANDKYVLPARVLGVTPEQIEEAGGTEAFCKFMDKSEDFIAIRKMFGTSKDEIFRLRFVRGSELCPEI